MTTNNNLSQTQELIEMAMDCKFVELKKQTEALYGGKIVSKKNGGFKHAYDLPSNSSFENIRSKVMNDCLPVRICHNSWLWKRNSGWIRAMCVLFRDTGILLVYINSYKGYAVRLSSAKKMKTISPRKRLPIESPSEFCTIKFKWSFGKLEIKLTKNQIKNWRVPLTKAFDAQYPCIETQSADNYATMVDKIAKVPDKLSVTTPVKRMSFSDQPASMSDKCATLPHSMHIRSESASMLIPSLEMGDFQKLVEFGNIKEFVTSFDEILQAIQIECQKATTNENFERLVLKVVSLLDLAIDEVIRIIEGLEKYENMINVALIVTKLGEISSA